MTLKQWGGGAPTPKPWKICTVGTPYTQFHIYRFNQPWIVKSCSMYLVKKLQVKVDLQSSNPCCSRVNCNNDYHLIQPHLLTTIFFFLSHQFSICLFLAPRQIWGPLFCYSTTLCKFYSFISLNCCHYFTCYHICNTLLQEKHM